MIVIALLAIVLVILTGIYLSLEERADLSTVSDRIVNVLRLSHSKTVASEESSVYGVHFESGKYTMFKGATYDSLDTGNEVFDFNARLEIYDISLNGGGDDVIFDRISGNTSQFGSLGVRIIQDLSSFVTIQINSIGTVSIEISSALPPSGSRFSDSRHVHFDLGWSIQNSTDLILEFPGFQTETIPMVSYFNATSSEFNWQGIINVSGEDQDLQVHTHFLDGVDTDLCIHRDRQNNTKALNVYIDDSDIVSYDADGSATVWGGGGTMEIQ